MSLNVNKKELLLIVLLICSSVARASVWSDPTSRLDKNFTDYTIQGGMSIVVEAIIHSEDRKLAIVNGKTVKVGDAVKQYVVQDITSNSILLYNGSQYIEIELFKIRKIKD